MAWLDRAGVARVQAGEDRQLILGQRHRRFEHHPDHALGAGGGGQGAAVQEVTRGGGYETTQVDGCVWRIGTTALKRQMVEQCLQHVVGAVAAFQQHPQHGNLALCVAMVEVHLHVRGRATDALP